VKDLQLSVANNILICIVIAFIGGIALSSLIDLPPHMSFWLAALCILFIFFFWHLQKYNASLSLLCICFFIFGPLLTGTVRHESTSHTLDFLGDDEIEEAVIFGVLEKMVTGNNQNAKALIKTSHLKTKHQPAFSPMHTLIQISVPLPWPPELLPGDTLVVRTRLRAPPLLHTPGSFDYGAYLQRRSIAAIGTVSSPILVQKVRTSLSAHPLSPSHRIERLRASIGTQLDAHLNPDGSSIYRAILLGDTSHISPEIKDAFRSAGIAHILAISGMHLAMLAMIVIAFSYLLLKRSETLLLHANVRTVAVLISLPVLIFYTLIAGANPPVVRASIMVAVGFVALSARRRTTPLIIVSFAALILAIDDPLIIYSPSFQLSFAAVVAILLLAVPLFSRFIAHRSTADYPISMRIKDWLLAACLVSLSATLGTMPLVIYHFNHLPLLGIVANLLVEPLICLWSLPLGFLFILTMDIAPTISPLFLHIGEYGITLSIWIATFIENIAFSSLWLPDPYLAVIFVYFTSLVLMCTKISRWLTCSAAATLCFCILLFIAPATGIDSRIRHAHSVSFISVGHGSASLVELTDGRTILIDAGAVASPDFDIGERLIAPFLWHRGIARLDDIFITHDDYDHINGIPALIKRFRPHHIWLPYEKALSDKSGYRNLIEQAKRSGVAIGLIPDVYLLDNEGNRALGKRLCHQHFGDTEVRSCSENDSGALLRVETDSFTVLFPGDISSGVEQELVNQEFPLEADILLAAHHGLPGSNSKIFIEAIRPQVLIVSNRSGNDYLKNNEDENIFQINSYTQLLPTSQYGTITITGERDGFSISTGLTPAPNSFTHRMFALTPR
jgi:competence protein ComEC